MLVLVSSLVAGIEKRAEAREVMAMGLEHAPTPVSYTHLTLPTSDLV